jgi:hypothetical protein
MQSKPQIDSKSKSMMAFNTSVNSSKVEDRLIESGNKTNNKINQLREQSHSKQA